MASRQAVERCRSCRTLGRDFRERRALSAARGSEAGNQDHIEEAGTGVITNCRRAAADKCWPPVPATRGRKVRETSSRTPWPQWGQRSESSAGNGEGCAVRRTAVGSGRFCGLEQLPAQGQLFVADTVGQEAEAADADEPPGEHVLHKPPQELLRREGHPPPAMAVGVVLVAERDLTVRQGLDPVVADRHAIGVAGQVLQRLFRSAERRLRIDDPFLLIQRCEEPRELPGVGQRRQALRSTATPRDRTPVAGTPAACRATGG